MSFESWLAIIGIIVGIIGIVWGVLQVFYADRLKAWQEKRALDIRNKTLATLEKEYYKTKDFYYNRSNYYLYLLIELLPIGGGVLSFLTALVVSMTALTSWILSETVTAAFRAFWNGQINTLSALIIVAGFIFMSASGPTIITTSLSRIVQTTYRIANFVEYEKKALARIERLRGEAPNTAQPN